ncbi:hypothetical protein ADK65_08315 [Streptomyces sp. NRRL B-1140]|uniref:hypothetical protein n=1 Tax=Streptomyces sp. NRRL B-1140 TaxID=1415549 RepID=UPI0006ADB260|nr:hypothetical protein ADK65_08315 [Streptomyces sp. NRRL B-1140]
MPPSWSAPALDVSFLIRILGLMLDLTMPGFSAASGPAHRFRCDHPVREDEPTRGLVHRRTPMEAP